LVHAGEALSDELYNKVYTKAGSLDKDAIAYIRRGAEGTDMLPEIGSTAYKDHALYSNVRNGITVGNRKGVYAALSDCIYNNGCKGKNGYTRYNGHLPAELLEHSLSFDSGLTLGIYGSGSDAIVAFRGTKKNSLRDWMTNLGQLFGFRTDQYTQTAATGHALMGGTLLSNGIWLGLSITGHSKGGGQAALAGTVSNLPTYTFNAAQLNNLTLKRHGVNPNSSFGNIDSTRLNNDPISWFNANTVRSIAEYLVSPVVLLATGNWKNSFKSGLLGKTNTITGCNLFKLKCPYPNPVKAHKIKSVIERLKFINRQGSNLSPGSGE